MVEDNMICATGQGFVIILFRHLQKYQTLFLAKLWTLLILCISQSNNMKALFVAIITAKSIFNSLKKRKKEKKHNVQIFGLMIKSVLRIT